MRTRLWLNGVMLLLAGLLAIWIYLDSQEPESAALSTRDAATVERIVVDQRDSTRMTFVRAGQGWRMQEPRELPASGHHIDMLLRFLELPVASRYPLAEVDHAGVGLSGPVLALRFDEQRYQFGGQDPMSLRRYLLHENEVLLVQEGVSAILQSPWWNFIDRRLLAEGVPVVLEFADGRRFEPDDLGIWQQHWQQGQAAIVMPQAPGSKGKAFELGMQSGERIAWQWLDGDQPQLLRPDLGLAYQVSTEQLRALLGKP